MKNRWIWPVVALALMVVTVISLMIFLGKRGKGGDQLSARPGSGEGSISTSPGRPVKLFFFTDSSSLMVPVERELFIPQIREEIYKKFIELLLEGAEGYTSPVPSGTILLAAHFLKDAGALVLDFNENVRTVFPGGSAAEQEFVYFFVDNVCFNFPEVKKVCFLFGGNEQRELSGHLDMERAFYPDYSRLANAR